jgi:hypothetical protein
MMTSLYFLSILGPSQKERGGRVVLDSVYGSHLTCRNLDSFQSAYNNLKYSKEINTTNIKIYISQDGQGSWQSVTIIGIPMNAFLLCFLNVNMLS